MKDDDILDSLSPEDRNQTFAGTPSPSPLERRVFIVLDPLGFIREEGCSLSEARTRMPTGGMILHEDFWLWRARPAKSIRFNGKSWEIGLNGHYWSPGELWKKLPPSVRGEYVALSDCDFEAFCKALGIEVPPPIAPPAPKPMGVTSSGAPVFSMAEAMKPGSTSAPEPAAKPEFTKHDSNKTAWSILPWRAIELVARVMMHGRAKYGTDNWKKASGNDVARYEDAMLRHYVAWLDGEQYDGDSRLPHLAHLACNAVFLLWHHHCKGK